MNLSEFIKKFEEEVVMEEPGTVNLESVLDDLVGWDSVAVISLMSVMDQEFGVTLNPEQIKQFQTLSDIVKLVEDKLN